MNLQAALFAVFALFIYLIGRELAGRPLGIGLGVLAALRGVNSILGASLIDLSSPKQMLTDFPTAVGLALLLYLTIQWLKRPREKRLFVFWAGGLIGLLSLTRTNALLMILPLAWLVWIVYRRKLRAVFGLGFVLFAMVLVSIYPWGVSSQRSIFDVYYIKFRNVLDQRYHFQLPLPDAVTPTGASRLSAPIRYQPPAAESLGAGFIAQGLYHNLLTSFLSLPASPQLHELRYTVKKAFPFWNNNWDGNFDIAESLFLLLQLACCPSAWAWPGSAPTWQAWRPCCFF